jgi:hypothetical protein
MLSLVLLTSYAPSRAYAAAVVVTSSADEGPGTFRDAIEQANIDTDITVIVLANWIPITLVDTVEYTGYQNLTITGNGAFNRVIQGTGFSPNGAVAQTECSLFESTGGADLTLNRVTFQNTSCNGVEVYGENGDGEIFVTLTSVVIRNMGGTGLYLYEGNGDSDAGWNLKMVLSLVERTGYYEYPAVNVEEYYDGNVTVALSGTSIVNNYWEGLNLDEEDYGQLTLTASTSKFNGNGGENEFEDEAAGADDEAGITDHLDGDGIDAEECGDGDLVANLSSVQANENFEDGIDLFECGYGDLRLTGSAVTANYNETENGIQAAEEDDGSNVTRLSATRTSNNGDDGVDLYENGYGDIDVRVSGSVSNWNGQFSDEDGDGYEIEEDDEGDLIAVIASTTANNNSDNGFFLGEAGDGDLNANLTSSTANDNQDDGFDFEEDGDGDFTVQLINSFAQGNDDFAVDATADGDPGTILLTGSVLIGGVNLENVNEI